jgi:hypothetical protein
VYVPDRQHVTVASLRDGAIMFLPGNRQVIPNRPIVGVTLRATSAASVDTALARAGIATPPRLLRGDTVSIFLPPAETHGVWIEFRAPKER